MAKLYEQMSPDEFADHMSGAKKKARPKWGEPKSHVTRKTTAAIFSAGKARAVIVTVYPDGVIGLRLSKHRTEEFIDAANAYRNAVVMRKANEREAKKKKRKAGGAR